MAEIARKTQLPGVRVSQLTVFKGITDRSANERCMKDVTDITTIIDKAIHIPRGKSLEFEVKTTIGTTYFKSLNSTSFARVIWLLSSSLFSGDHLYEACRRCLLYDEESFWVDSIRPGAFKSQH